MKGADGFRRYCKPCGEDRPRAGHAPDADAPWRIFHITDTHVPDHDPAVWVVILEMLEHEQPDEILIMGDFAEVAAFSQHGRFQAAMTHWETEKAAVREKLQELRDVCHDATITYLEGNHETRIRRYLSDSAPQLVDTLTLPREFDLDRLNIQWIPEGQQPIFRGNLAILHGHQMGRGKGGFLPVNHSKRACELYGAPNRVITYGHVHKHQVWEVPMYGGPTRAMAIGCSRTLEAPWLLGVSGWRHQVAMSYIQAGGAVSLYPIDITVDGAVWNGRNYRLGGPR